MRLLAIVQKVDINDDILGFIHAWIEKLAQKLDKLYVICLTEGEHHLPDNVKVYSLGKEKGYSKLRKLFLLQKFLLKHLPEVKGVFSHMCPIYAILAFPLTKIFSKKLVLWFAHYRKSWKIKVASVLSDVIVTSTRFAYPLESSKLRVIGQGIDIEKFKVKSEGQKRSGKFRLLFLSRISPIKDLETLIKALDVLVNKKSIKDIHLDIVGSPSVALGDSEYYQKIKGSVKDLNLENFVSFKERIPNYQTPDVYNSADLFVNLTRTGSFDKTTLEAMSCQTLVVVSNQVYKGVLPDYLIFSQSNPQDLAGKIENIIKISEEKRREIGKNLREIIIKNHNLDNLTQRIIDSFK